MKTDQATHDTPQALGSTEGLGPLPPPGKVLREPPAFYKDEWREHHFYTADQMRAYAAEQVAAQRERITKQLRRWADKCDDLADHADPHTCASLRDLAAKLRA